jgi:tetratricopeptide (TPR) repeat protein
MNLNPEFLDAWVPLALANWLKTAEEAEKTYLELSSKDQTGLPGRCRQRTWLSEGRLNDARKILETGIQADLKNKFEDEASLKSVMRAQTLLAQGRTKEAILAADRVAAASNNGSHLFSIAMVYIQAGQPELGAKVAETLNAKPNPELQAYARIIEGEVAQKKGDIPGAVGLYHKSTALLDTWVGHLALGCAYLEANEYIEAHSEFDLCLKRRGEAASIFLDDLPSYRQFAPIYYYLGRAQEGLKSPAAKESYQKFLKIKERADPGDPLVDDAHRRLKNL